MRLLLSFDILLSAGCEGEETASFSRSVAFKLLSQTRRITVTCNAKSYVLRINSDGNDNDGDESNNDNGWKSYNDDGNYVMKEVN